jgi:hypothetical protein
MASEQWEMETVQRLARIEASIEALRTDLFGNGGIGLCVRSKEERTELFHRMREVETSVNKQKGALAAIGAIAGAVAGAVIEAVARLIRGG